MTKANVLIVKTGSSNPAVRVALGDYDRWFVNALGRERLSYDCLPAHEGASPPVDPRQWAGMIVTGSPRSVTERTDWMLRWGEWLVNAAEKRVPVLAVCFGHQLVGQTLGGTVRKNPKGREIGTVRCTLTEEGMKDPLFEGISQRFEVNATHEDYVESVPSVVQPLAGNENTALQAFSSGRYLRGVQFHPEIESDVMRAMVGARREGLMREAEERGLDPERRIAELEAGIRSTPAGKRILENFVRNFVNG